MTTKKIILTYPEWVPPDPLSVLLTNETKTYSGHLYHTTLGDISPQNLIKFITDHDIDFLEFIDLEDRYKSKDLYYQSKLISLYFGAKGKSTVTNDPDQFLVCATSRITTSPVLWAFGCSLTHGVGVGTSNCYSTLVSKSLGLPLSNISLPGSSTRWLLRHLINSDITKDDTVIWQITTMERFSVFKQGRASEVILKHATDKNWVLCQCDEQMVFDQLSLLNYGVRYLRSIGCRFAVISLDSANSYSKELVEQYVRYKEFVYVPGWICDLGSDNQHPGILSHKLLAEHITKTLKYTNE